MAVFTALNFLSVRKLAHTNSAATWWKVGVPVLTIVVLAIATFHPGNFTAADGFAPTGAGGVLAAVSTSGIIFALLGFEQADQLAGESANPKRDIPRAVIGAIVIGAMIYILLQIVFLAALPASQIGSTWAGSPFTTFSGPFAQLATLVGVGWLATILYIDAVISPAGTGLIYTTAASRVSYGLSRNGYVPSIYERTDRRGIPWFGLITAFVVGCICFLPFPSWKSLVGLITSASVLMYAGAPLALGVFRSRLPDAERPYRLPAARVLAPLAFAVANLLILWSGWTTDWKLGIAILIGYVILIANQLLRAQPDAPRFEVRSAVWLPVYLIGHGPDRLPERLRPDREPLVPALVGHARRRGLQPRHLRVGTARRAPDRRDPGSRRSGSAQRRTSRPARCGLSIVACGTRSRRRRHVGHGPRPLDQFAEVETGEACARSRTRGF